MNITTGPATDPATRKDVARIVAPAMLASPTSWLLMAALFPLPVAVIVTLDGDLTPGVLAGLVLMMPPLYLVALWLALRFTSSPKGGVWWIGRDERGAAAVCVARTGHTHSITSLGARPRGTGLGTELLTAVLDTHPHVHGVAFCTTATRYYRQHLKLDTTPIRWTGGLFHTITTESE